MRILTVIPISRGISKDTLTYFTTKDINVGSIVSIFIRKKTAYGLVTESKVAKELKSELKSLTYNIRKVENIEARTFLSDKFIKSCEIIADYNAGSVGATLSALIPKTILENMDKLSYKQTKAPDGIFHETVLLQSETEERYATYRSLIREEFAKNRSVFFCLPTTEDILNAKSILEKGIEKYTTILHSGLPKKEMVTLWQKIVDDEHPQLIIATGSFLALPRNDLGTIILEKESSRAYKMQMRPFIDIRTAAGIMAKQYNIRLVLGDMLLRTETLWEEKNQSADSRYSEVSPLKFRSLTTAVCELVSTRTPQDMKKKEFQIFSDKLKNLILEAGENNEHTFLFCGRKGLYPITVCGDCGTVVVCKNCNAPVVLYGKPTSSKTARQGGLFVCHHCGERRDASELCLHCGSWRLNPLGIGIENVVLGIKSILPEAKILIMDKEHISTHKQAVKTRDLFYGTPGSIMVGTEMALTYLNEKIENVAVVSIDSYFGVPDFQINEKIFHILLSLRALSEKHLMFQTRQENTKLFDYALRGSLSDFYRDEIEERKSVGFPPFTTYIKITLEGEKNNIKKQMDEIAGLLKPYELSIYDAFNPGNKMKYMINGLISIPRGKWPSADLLSKLRLLPLQCLVKVDPATLL